MKPVCLKGPPAGYTTVVSARTPTPLCCAVAAAAGVAQRQVQAVLRQSMKNSNNAWISHLETSAKHLKSGQLALLSDWQHSFLSSTNVRDTWVYFFRILGWSTCDIGGAAAAAFPSRFSCIKAFSFCHWSKSSRAQGKPPSCDGGGSFQLLSRSIYTRYIGCSSVTPLLLLSACS